MRNVFQWSRAGTNSEFRAVSSALCVAVAMRRLPRRSWFAIVVLVCLLASHNRGAQSAATAASTVVSLDGSDWMLRSGDSDAVCNNASVPGGVWDNLSRAGIVGDPLYRDNDVRYINATTARAGGWTLSKTFDAPTGASSDAGLDTSIGVTAALLEFDGVQGLGNISLNGRHILATDNMFRQWRVALPAGLLMPSGNVLQVHLDAVPAPVPSNGAAPQTVRTRIEADAWGWDWSPDLNPMALWGSVRLISTSSHAPHLSMFSPTVTATLVDSISHQPTEFRVVAAVEVVTTAEALEAVAGGRLTGSLTLSGDWGNSTTVALEVAVPAHANSRGFVHDPVSTTFTAELFARVPDVRLWWPRHYGQPHLHTLRADICWHGVEHQPIRSGGSAPLSRECVAKTSTSKRIGFRSVALFTGTNVPAVPKRSDPAHADDFVGCFRDGNPYWGCAPGFSRTCQHALPFLAANDDDGMTVSRCISLCAAASSAQRTAAVSGAAANYTLAGLQDGTRCYCGAEIGRQCDGCMPLVGTLADPSECGSPCSGDAGVACGGASYMWGSNSVYNVTSAVQRQHSPRLRGEHVTATASTQHPPAASASASAVAEPAGQEGSGDSGFALVINGVKVFARGGNLVPFELLEATVNASYVNRTVRSAAEGGMNMLRVWGGGIYQADAFYEECDRLGVMLYHDMMFCQRFYPHDAAFVGNVKAELQYQLQRLRPHPSIVLWDSSNENEGDPAFFYSTVLQTIAEADATRPLWPASPSSGFDAGVHTATGLPNGNTLVGRFAGTRATLDTHMPYNFCNASYVTSTQRNVSTYFKSEFGQVSLPAWETLAPALNGSLGDWGVFSDIMVHRKHAGADLAKPLASVFGVDAAALANTTEAAFKRVIYLTQLAQVLCVKTVVEELRRGDHTFGALLWQLNDVWQASSWGSLDYGGRWRALHHVFQAVFAPTVVSVWVDGATLRVYGSHHGAAAQAAMGGGGGGGATTSIEINVTSVATGASTLHHIVDGIDDRGTAVIVELLNMSMSAVDPTTSVITTRLLSRTTGQPIEASETVHPLLLDAGNLVGSVQWVDVSASDVTLVVSRSTVTNANATVTVRNGAAAPLFYAVVTSTFAGRFSHNVMLVPGNGTRTLEFLFARDAAALESSVDVAAFENSLSVAWLNAAP